MSETERFEERDGKTYRVTVLPAQRPRKQKQTIRTKAEARAIAVGKSLGARHPKIVKCSKCGRKVPEQAVPGKGNPKGSGQPRKVICGSCSNPSRERKWKAKPKSKRAKRRAARVSRVTKVAGFRAQLT